jgi:hypothetical protein
MADFNIRSDSINVEQIMEQIRSRIRDKRGVDYTEQQIRDLAAVKLEKFLDPRGVRSDMLEEFRRMRPASDAPARPSYEFNDTTLFETHRGPLRVMRRLLRPILKLFFNPNPLIQALHIQSRLNALEVEAEAARRARDELTFEVMHNLVLETTRMGIEVKNLKMRVESLASRLEFNERRGRALESAVVYKPAGEQPPDRGFQPSFTGPGRPEFVEARPPEVRPGPTTSPGGQPPVGPEGPGQRSRRRRRRRGRRGGASAAATLGASGTPPATSDVSGLSGASPVQRHDQGPAGDTVEQPVAPQAPPNEPPPVSGSGSGDTDPDAQ